MGLVVNNRSMVATSGGADCPPFLMAGTNSVYATALVTGTNGTTPKFKIDFYQSNDAANWVFVGSTTTTTSVSPGDVLVKDSGVAIGAAWGMVKLTSDSGTSVEVTLNVNTSQR